MDNTFENNIYLIKQLIEGNEKAYIHLVNFHHKALFVYALSLTNDPDMSKDIVQNVFIRTWEFRRNLKKEYTLKGFLYKCTYNEFINLYHRKKSLMNLEKIYVETLNETIDDKNEDLLNKKIKLVSEEIENLPKKCKETFLLSKKEGLTNMEIAEYLNISIKTVEAHITKSYSILKKSVQNKLKLFLFFMFKMMNIKNSNSDVSRKLIKKKYVIK